MNKKPLAVLQIVHLAMCFGIVLVFVILLILKGGFPAKETDFTNPLFYLAVILTIGSLLFNFMIYPGRTQKIKDDTSATAQAKLAKWQSLFFLRNAIAEAACIGCLVGIYFDASQFFVYLYILNLVFFIYNFPTKTKVIDALGFNSSEAEQL
jgi:hypothetical protein